MPDSTLVAAVTARGKTITNFESLMVRRDFHNGVSVFSFTPTEITAGDMKLQPGDPVTIALGGHQVINGAVTTRSVAYDAQSHQVVIAGKSWTADVHDSSVPVQPGSFDGLNFEQIARSVLKPHNVGLVMRNPSATASMPFVRMRVQYGETCGDLQQPGRRDRRQSDAAACQPRIERRGGSRHQPGLGDAHGADHRPDISQPHRRVCGGPAEHASGADGSGGAVDQLPRPATAARPGRLEVDAAQPTRLNRRRSLGGKPDEDPVRD